MQSSFYISLTTSQQSASNCRFLLNTQDYFYFPREGETDRTRPFQCTACVRRFPTEEDLAQHLKRHSRLDDSELYFCLQTPGCGTFKRLEDFELHRQTCFRADEQAKLQIQGSGQTLLEETEDEVQKYQESREHLLHFPECVEKDASHPFKCGLCVRRFAKRFNFEQHLLQHHR